MARSVFNTRLRKNSHKGSSTAYAQQSKQIDFLFVVYKNVVEPFCREVGVTFGNSRENSFVVS
jgi:hypothetical protein